MTTDLVTRLRALAELQAHPTNQAALREAADALESASNPVLKQAAQMMEQELYALKAKLAEAESRYPNGWEGALKEQVGRRQKAEAEAAALREALSWYAHEAHKWRLCADMPGPQYDFDRGSRARAALKETK